jgi:Helix-turn-helix family
MDIAAVWHETMETLEALGVLYFPDMEQAAAQAGLPTPEWNGWLLAALMFEPKPLSARLLRTRAPYTSARLFDERLTNAARKGFLTPVGGAGYEYRLTQLGRRAAESVNSAMYAKMATLQPIPPNDLERLASLLHRLVVSCLAAPEPPGKWYILHYRRMDPGEDASVVARIDQYGGDLAAYRDDAHLASWKPHDIEGHAWEAFTCLWRRESRTLDELYQKLEHRCYTRDEYGQALKDLMQRGWVMEDTGKYQISVPGRKIRRAAEKLTDQYFYAPWSCLSQVETQDLRNSLMLLRAGLLLGS